MDATLEQALRARGDDFDIVTLRSLLNYWDVAQKQLLDGEAGVKQVIQGHREELKDLIANRIKDVYKNILTLLEVGLAQHPELYEKMRTKVLRISNDGIRDLKSSLNNYHVLGIATSQTRVIFDAGKDIDNGTVS